MSRIKEENIIERWFAGIIGASGKSEELLRDFNKRVEEAAIPGISLAWEDLTPAEGMMKRMVPQVERVVSEAG